MAALFYVQLFGLTAGTLLHLFLIVLLVGHRRRRAFELLLFLATLAVFLFYSGALLFANVMMQFAAPPRRTLQFAFALVAVGLGTFPALLVHLHAEYSRVIRETPRPVWLRGVVVLAYVPLAFFFPLSFSQFLRNPSLEFLWWDGSRDLAYGVWLGGALLVACLFNGDFARRPSDPRQVRLHHWMTVFFGAAAAIVMYTYVLGAPRDPLWPAALFTTLTLWMLLPGAFLGHAVLRRSFLETGVQRNLVYAVSAAFVALLYLTVALRVSDSLRSFFPPVATLSILLFVLVFFFEPLQRRVARALRSAFRIEVERVQRLIAEIQQQARHGELQRLVEFSENRIRDALGLAAVRLVLREGPARPAATSGRVQRFVLRQGKEEIGALEAYHHSGLLSGETYAAVEFLAEQLPAAVDLCRLIEDKLRLERELAARERLALVGQMAASISHNLKNPLSSMKTVLQVQLENPALPADLRKDCQLVVAEIDRLAAKLGQLLQYAKPAVRASGSRPRVAAVALARQVVGLLQREAERRNVTLDLDCPGDELHVAATEEAFSDVLTNLVVNAMEAVPAGGAVRVSLARQSADLVLEVTDNGPGVPPEFREKLFQPFFTTKPTGTGLGLAVVERRLAETDGAISWESPTRNGRGCRFTVTLPVADLPL